MEQKIEQIARDVVDASVKLHGKLGPGLLESVYEVILCKELQKQGYRVERQRPIRIEYEGTVFDEGFRTDLWIGNCFIVELKSVEKLAPLHGKQLLTYLRLTGLRLGLLINFGEEILENGLKRIAN
jgi:iron complex transport system substrate-binding protein